MNELIVGTWWFLKDHDTVYAYKGPNPPSGLICGDNCEFNWVNLKDSTDFCWMPNNLKIRILSSELNFINLDCLESRLSKVTIYKSGDYIVEDYEYELNR